MVVVKNAAFIQVIFPPKISTHDRSGIHSFNSLSHDKSKASSKASSPYSAI
jgi:hypothetical protein